MKVSEFVHCAVDNARGRSSWNLGMWMGRGGYFILIKTFVVQVLIKKMLRVVDKIIIQGYLENADRVHVFLKNIGSLMNSLREIAMKILM